MGNPGFLDRLLGRPEAPPYAMAPDGPDGGELACGTCGATPLVVAVATDPEARCLLFFGDLGGPGFRHLPGETGLPAPLMAWLDNPLDTMPEVRCDACGTVLIRGRVWA